MSGKSKDPSAQRTYLQPPVKSYPRFGVPDREAAMHESSHACAKYPRLEPPGMSGQTMVSRCCNREDELEEVVYHQSENLRRSKVPKSAKCCEFLARGCSVGLSMFKGGKDILLLNRRRRKVVY